MIKIINEQSSDHKGSFWLPMNTATSVISFKPNPKTHPNPSSYPNTNPNSNYNHFCGITIKYRKINL